MARDAGEEKGSDKDGTHNDDVSARIQWFHSVASSISVCGAAEDQSRGHAEMSHRPHGQMM